MREDKIAGKMSNAVLDTGRPEIPACWALESEAGKGASEPQDGWAGYWESLGGTERFFREQAKEYVANLECAVELNRDACVLDFGCGFGFVAELLTSKVAEVFLWDHSANMRRRARGTLAYCQNIRFLDLSKPRPMASELKFDVIVVNSVAQYMSPDQFVACLRMWRSMVATGGRIVVSDLIPTRYNLRSDLLDLFKFSFRHRVLGSALRQAIRDFGRYWVVRRNYPLRRMGVEELREISRTADLSLTRLSNNLTYFRQRLTVVFTEGTTDTYSHLRCSESQ